MNFEDIVDMEWVDTHTTLEDTSAFSSEFYFDQQPDFLLENSPLTPPQVTVSVQEPEIKMEPISSMPTTEQIKQLIEIAKRQLALREQQQPQQQIQTEGENLFQPLITETQLEANHVAAPSPFFSMPPIPALSPTTVSTSDITAVENATTLETIAKQMNSSNGSDTLSTTSNTTNTTTKRRDSLASMPDEAISLEAYAEADGIDLKKLTPKERRQLRNKLSARNFRVRRKEYISTLEGQVNDHKLAAEALKDKLQKVEEENKKLRKEMDTLKRQNQILLSQQVVQSPRLQKPNLNKDLSIMGTKATDSYRQQDNFILVSNAVMPVWDYTTILQQQQPKTDPYLNHLVGQFLFFVVQQLVIMPHRTNQIEEKNDSFTLPLMPDDRDFTCSSSIIKSSIASSSSSTTTASFSPSSSSSSSYISSHLLTNNYINNNTTTTTSYMEDLYDVLIQSALINNSNTDKSFWWWDNKNQSPAM